MGRPRSLASTGGRLACSESRELRQFGRPGKTTGGKIQETMRNPKNRRSAEVIKNR